MPGENAVIEAPVEAESDGSHEELLVSNEDLLVESLIEDISIDGMCGVY